MKDKKIRKLQGVGEKFEKLLNKDKIYLVGDMSINFLLENLLKNMEKLEGNFFIYIVGE